MELGICSVVSLLILSSLTFQLTSAENSVSVLFIDSQNRQYFRRPSTSDDAQPQTMLLPEVGASVSVLLGLTPPATITAASSSKLNEVLAPNPFDRPRTVFLLEVSGSGPTNLPLNNAFTSKIITGSDKADIQLPDRDEISVISLDERQGDFADKEISDFASWLGGSYANDDINGKLTIPTANGGSVDLQLSKKTDMKLVESLLVLFRNTKSAIEMHEDLPLGMQKPAELMMGHFDGVKVLQEDYNSERAQQMSELLLLTVSKLFERLQLAHKGQIAGVILFNKTPSSVPNTMLNVMFTSQPSARWLAENDVSISPTTIAEVVLVRLTLAWLTGIILIISTLLGIYFLLNMPLTRDTLLYSNVKLD